MKNLPFKNYSKPRNAGKEDTVRQRATGACAFLAAENDRVGEQTLAPPVHGARLFGRDVRLCVLFAVARQSESVICKTE